MRWVRLPWLVCTIAGCAPKHVPDHLRIAPPTDTSAVAPPVTFDEAARQVVDIDPLVRRPEARSPEWWSSAPDALPIVAWSEAVGHGSASPSSLDALEASWPGSIAVPLARGARLSKLETALPTATPDDAGDRALVVWLGTFTVRPNPGPSDVRPPLGWLAPDRATARQHLLHLSERAVLLGWLSSPDLPAAVVVEAMVEGRYDRLRSRPEGALLLARADAAQSEEAGTTGTLALDTATELALVRAAADGPIEQQRAQKLARKRAVELGLEESADPMPVLLEQARLHLTDDAGVDASAGLALVAIAAARVGGHCPDAPCEGVDRIAMLQQATVWSPEEVGPYSHAWRIVAAKDALDQLTVAVENKRPTYAFPLVADILVGERAERVPLSLLLQRSLGPEACLAITRGLGAPDGTAPQDVLKALDDHIHALCADAPTELAERWTAPMQAICE